ncbi:MAG: ATP-dependent DNA helicase RecG [Candidatus Peregrinibacteria bacterium Gr01-1014_25]|nr:MAG: ATP-dependent DNA helicase RecG [Candidatus Peregrinibacteria bacterium Gr01-1014_25]
MVALDTPVGKVLRTTTAFLQALEAMEIRTVKELLLYLPRAHEDLSDLQTLANAPLGEKVVIRGTISRLKAVRIRGRRTLVTALFTDEEGGQAEAVWFNQPHVKRMLADDEPVVLTGKLREERAKLQFMSPQFERAGTRPLVHSGRLVPVYPQHDVITSRWLREKMVLVRDAIPLLPETLPEDVLRDENLPSRAVAIDALHFPDDVDAVERARGRMAFEELFMFQRAALERKRDWQGVSQERLRIPMEPQFVRQFFASLKFTPTASQKIAIYEILKDMEKDVPMSRLLEGDVGSGKTLVAVVVMASALRAGGQCALMVPTEVLARQHAETVTRLLVTFHAHMQREGVTSFLLPRVQLLTGSTPASEATGIRTAAAAGTIDILIGTHALIEDGVRFRDLKLAIVDEQHRFGVVQRARLKDKGSPHFLAMTATPIPRTLALTAFGDHDLSVLLEKPGNRRAIATRVVPPADRATVERFIDREITSGRQAFVICPLIDASSADELQEVTNVAQEVERLRTAFPRRRITSLHGRMRPQEKEETMRQFKAGAFDILVSTAVIEVGIDVPNSTVIVIEGAERFGLAQLHQFRGRVGRAEHKSHCFLFTTTPAQALSPRLKAMEEYDSGFHLAEIDLKLRGPGDMFGIRQSGIPEGLAPLLLSPELVMRARRAAERTMGMASERGA